MPRRTRSDHVVDAAVVVGAGSQAPVRASQADADHVVRRNAPARAGSILGSLKTLLGIKSKAEV